MKAYNHATGWFGKKSVHTVRVTLMQEDYIGHVAYELYGNYTGADALDVDYFLETAEKFTENDCEFEWTEDFFSATLRNESGDKLPISGMDTDLRRLIVGMEIVDVRRVSA